MTKGQLSLYDAYVKNWLIMIMMLMMKNWLIMFEIILLI